jgi:hypothetical protein
MGLGYLGNGDDDKRQTDEARNNGAIIGEIKITYTGHALNLNLSRLWRLKHERNHEEKNRD